MNFPILQGLLKASTAQSLREYRGAMDALIRPPFVPTAPTMLKEWSLKEQKEFYENNPQFIRTLEVKWSDDGKMIQKDDNVFLK